MDIYKIQEKLEDKKQERSRLEGKFEAYKQELSDMGYKTVADAQKKVTQLEKETVKIQKEYDQSLTDFEKKYKGLL